MIFFFLSFYSILLLLYGILLKKYTLYVMSEGDKIRKANKVMTNQLIYTGKLRISYWGRTCGIKSVYMHQATMLNGARKRSLKEVVPNNQISSLFKKNLNAGGAATATLLNIWYWTNQTRVKIIPWRLFFVATAPFLKTFWRWRRFGIENSNRWIYYKNDDLMTHSSMTSLWSFGYC